MGVPISNVTRRVVYSASGTGPYNFTFEILANTDVAVYKDDALLTLTTDYTVTINSNGTGFITLTASPTGATQIAIVGNRTIQRTTDFVTGGDFFANTVNDEMDQQTIFAQQNAEAIDRALKAPQTDPTSINMTLPRASVRANKTLAFDTNGNPTTGEVIGDNRGNWAAGTAYNKRDIVKDTSNGNVYYANTAHTSTGSQPISTNADSAKWDLIVDNASAGASASAAAASASAAATSASNASTSATNAASSASTASTQASNASTSATNAANSATAAASSASTASTAATNAGNSATTAATSATNASNSASSASTSATNASNSATSAATSASQASTSASNAASSASTATTQASNAATSATNAANSATASANSATAAAASAAAAAASFDAFDDIYLGAKSSDPTVDNDGNALTTGDQYFNTSANELRVYNGSTWQAASTVGGTVTSLSVTGATTLGQNPTLSAGTANGVAYLNGSKVLTTGTSLVFDGSMLTVNRAAAGEGIATSVGSGAVRLDTSVTHSGNGVVVLNAYPTGSPSTASQMVWQLGGSEQMRLTSTGLGIGTSSPAARLHIASATTDDGLRIQNTSTANSTAKTTRVAFYGTDTGSSVKEAANIYTLPENANYINTALTFQTRRDDVVAERMRIDSSGNVGIGTSSPGYRLDTLLGAGAGNIFRAGQSGVSNGYTITTSGSALTHIWANGGSDAMRLDSSGNLGLGVTPSAWLSTARAYQFSSAGSVWGLSGQNNVFMSGNEFLNSSAVATYIQNGFATRYQQLDGSHRWLTAPSGTAGNAITFTQAMTLDASGNLGIGATSVVGALHIAKNDAQLHLEDPRTTGDGSHTVSIAAFKSGTGYNNLDFDVARYVFKVSGTERARIDSSGNLLVGSISNPLYGGNRLVVAQNSSANQGSAALFQTTYSGDSANAAVFISKFANDNSSNNVFLRFVINNNASGNGQINGNGSGAAAFGSWSDRRLKENIADLPPQLANIMALRPVEFDYIASEGGGHQIGFIAQEMREVYPDAVGERAPDGMLTITGWSKTEARLVKAIQEQQAIIEQLKADVAALKGN